MRMLIVAPIFSRYALYISHFHIHFMIDRLPKIVTGPKQLKNLYRQILIHEYLTAIDDLVDSVANRCEKVEHQGVLSADLLATGGISGSASVITIAIIIVGVT